MNIASMSRGIRDRVVGPSAAETKLVRRRKGEAPIMRSEVLGVRHADHFQIPAAVWNGLVSAWSTGFQQMVKVLATACASGVESRLGGLLDKDIPDIVYALGRSSMEALLVSNRGFMGSRIHCHQCPGDLDFERDEFKTLTTRLGDIKFKRSYYHGTCKHSAAPADALLGVDGEHAMLPEIQNILAWLCTQMPYAPAAKVIKTLLPIPCSHTTAERVTATVATELQTHQDQECHEAFDRGTRMVFPEVDPVEAAPVAVVSTDGGFCRVRNYAEKSKEFKVGMLGTLLPVPRTTGVERELDVKSKRYVATTNEVESFYRRVSIEYHRMALNRCPVLQVIGDGAEWVLPRLKLLADPDQEVFAILDFYHALEHVSRAANLVFVPDSEQHKAWSSLLRHHLLNGKVQAFFAQLQAKKKSIDNVCPENAAELGVELNYFHERREYLRYKEALDRGLLIGSGIIEGGVRFVGKDRVYRTGMRWNIDGADFVLRLRAVDASQQWDAYCKKRAHRAAERYQSAKRAWAA